MKLRTKCVSCKKMINFNESVRTRPDLEIIKGESFLLNCDLCGSNQNTHINDVEAIESNSIIFIASAVFFMIAFILWFVFGAVGTIIIVVPLIIWQQHISSIRAFNIYKIPRRS